MEKFSVELTTEQANVIMQALHIAVQQAGLQGGPFLAVAATMQQAAKNDAAQPVIEKGEV